MIALAFTVGVLAGAYGLWAGFKVCDAWRNRPSRRAWRAEQREAYLARIHGLAAPTALETTAPHDVADLTGAAIPEDRRTPLASTAQRYARLRQLPPGRHHAEPSTVGPRRYALPGGA